MAFMKQVKQGMGIIGFLSQRVSCVWQGTISGFRQILPFVAFAKFMMSEVEKWYFCGGKLKFAAKYNKVQIG
ncbi:MAG: hypothetical protein IKN78_05755 [Bacteroidales bacterium]|nr:hypothetical protein [Bacteroidales bacterium]